jgi:hypothetical protein
MLVEEKKAGSMEILHPSKGRRDESGNLSSSYYWSHLSPVRWCGGV